MRHNGRYRNSCAEKGHKGQIRDGSTSQNTFHELYKLCVLLSKSAQFLAMLLYYTGTHAQ